MTEFVGDGEALAFAPIVGIDDNEGHGGATRVPGARGEPADGAEGQREYLDASFLEELDEVGDGLVAETPVTPKGVGGAVGFDGVAQYGMGRVARGVPTGAGKPENILDGDVALEVREHGGLDAGLVAPARERVLPELQVAKDELRIPEQVVNGGVQGVGERNEYGAPRHGLVPFVLADGLRRDAVADGVRKCAQRKPGRGARELESFHDHPSPPAVLTHGFTFLQN